MKSIFFIIITLSIFTGCSYTTYDYITPNTKEGFQCVYNCDEDYKRCTRKVDKEQKVLNEIYYARLERYKICKAYNDPKYIKKRADKYIFRCMKYNNKQSCKKQFYLQHKLRKCHAPYRQYASSSHCDSSYNICFKSCGGEIVPVKKELF